MSSLRFEITGIVQASKDERTITGLALPWDTPGNTSGGKVTVGKDAVSMPHDLRRVKLLRDHNREQPVGYVTNIESTEQGLMVTFRVGNTAEGDLALTEAAEGIRDGLSVELSSVKRSPDGKQVLSSMLDAVALVAVPAFSDARVSAVATDSDEDSESVDEPASEDAPNTEENVMNEENQNVTEPVVEAAHVPEGLIVPTKKAELSMSSVTDTLRAIRNGEQNADITAALADITRSANPWVSPEGFVGELWEGVGYERQVVPLLTNASLSHWKVTGWRWTTKPGVAAYAGDKAAIPSNSPVTESVSVEASRLAGGHDLDRKFIDFNDTEFIASYFRAMAESYAYESDKAASEFVTSSATVVTDANGGGDILKAALLGANKVKSLSRASASYILVNPEDMVALLGTKSADVPAFLDVLGINPRAFVSSELVPAGSVIVGAKAAATFYELGGSPIRVEAVSLANGGHDAAVFGYYATLLHSANGIVRIGITDTLADES